jgi:hypothetical protein
MKPLFVEPRTTPLFCGGPEEIESVLDPLCRLETELADGLALYWKTAGKILDGSGIHLAQPDSGTVSLERNFFSALFLYSYYRCRIGEDRRILYAAVNQCLRGMVTGCDNLLDDEYKETLETDLPKEGTRFRSVLDIMVSERVLFEILLDRLERGDIQAEMLRKAVRASLRALTRSGSQEASEEAGVSGRRLPPDAVLSTVHHFKTGLLFQCPWALPAVIERPLPSGIAHVKNALYKIGIACQMLDDMVDLTRDVRQRRHNYVASVIAWGSDESLKGLLSEMACADSPKLYLDAFYSPLREVYQSAMKNLDEALGVLFLEDHQRLVAPSAAFIAARIGADRILPSLGRGSA